jgi:hypothetical protein
VRAAIIVVLAVGGAISLAVLNAADAFDAIRTAAFVMLAVNALLSLSTLVTGRYPAWGQPDRHARPWAVSSLALVCAPALALAGFGNGRPVLASVLFILQIALISLSLVLVVSGRTRLSGTAPN